MSEHQVNRSGVCEIPGCPCRGWSAQETTMSKNEYQREQFPVGTIVEAIIPIGRGPMSDPFPVGTRGKVTSHCDDGRAWVFFDGEGHTFHEIEKFVRMVQAAKEVDEHQPAARGGGNEWHVVKTIPERPTSDIELIPGNKDGMCFETLRLPWHRQELLEVIVRYANGYPKAAKALNDYKRQHQSLVAERERLRQAIEVAIHNLNAGNDPKFLADYLRLTLDQQRSTSE